MQKAILFGIAGGVLFASASASAQAAPAPPRPSAPAPGTVDSRDVMSANRERDAATNRLAASGVPVTNKDRENARPKRAKAVPATAADIQPGAQVRDVKGVPLGTVATLAENEVVADPNQVVIDTGQTKIAVPLSAFGKDSQGLMLSITAEKFNQLVAQVKANAPAPEPETE